MTQVPPSTPIVPGTAGLSADFFQQHETTYTQKPSGRYEWKCSCGNSAEDFASWTDCHRFTRKHWSEAINALLGASKPAEPTDAALAYAHNLAWHRGFKAGSTSGEAQIRKDALREAFLLRPGLPHEWNSTQFREGYYAGLEAFRQAIEKVIAAERPAPAGEVKGEKS